MTTKVFVHQNPVWRKHANFIIGAWIPAQSVQTGRDWEQLWSRQLDENHFEICCIPFFVYDLALGDQVETDHDGEMKYMVKRVVNPSGHYTFRVWFGESTEQVIREVLEEISNLGCLMEFYSRKLLGVDAASASQAQELANFLFERQQLGHLVYETGRTK